MKRRFLIRTLAGALAAVLTAGCSIERMAINRIGNALASGGSTYASDDDPELVGEALPFGLKLIESLLAESPKHKGLLLAAASGFTQYGYVYAEQPADLAAAENLDRSTNLRRRARGLYLRAYAYGLRGLEASYPGLTEALDHEPATALTRVRKQDVPLLYWAAAAQGLAISVSKEDPEMIARLPLVEAIVKRALELDESWSQGALHEFLISMESARVGIQADVAQQRMKRHFERSLELSGGMRAGVFVTYAENACVTSQDRGRFKDLLEKALAVNPDAQPENRLANLVAQRRARWLLGHMDELFLEGADARSVSLSGGIE